MYVDVEAQKILGVSRRLVVSQQELLLNLLGVVGGRLHGVHAAGEFGGLGIIEQGQELRIQVERQHGIQENPWIGLRHLRTIRHI